jgi:mannose-6-phosphate isomerase-like protein (cupin superfamily)
VIQRFSGGQWPGVECESYKDEPGTWIGTTRRVLAEESKTGFQTRYFEVAVDGYTSFEQHQHEHVVVVLRGTGMVLLGETWHAIGQNDCVHVPPGMPHQFRNCGSEPFGILCVVDQDRDRPVLLGNPPPIGTSD